MHRPDAGQLLNWITLIGLASALIWNVQDNLRERKAIQAEIAEILEEIHEFSRVEAERDAAWKTDEDAEFARIQSMLDNHALERGSRVLALQADHMKIMAELADLRVECAQWKGPNRR